jgi:hypothetical protein
MQSTGQTCAQIPQSMQSLAVMTWVRRPVPKYSMQVVGQERRHHPQLMQGSRSMT